MHTEMLDRAMQRYVDNQTIPGGALMIDKGGKEVYRGLWGYSDPVHKKPMEYDTVMRLMSMTKPITAIAVLQLYEQGRLKLSDPVRRFFPDCPAHRVLPAYIWGAGSYTPSEAFPEGMDAQTAEKLCRTLPTHAAERDITIRDLLCHSSGLGQGVGNTMALEMMHPGETLAERTAKFVRLPLDFQPGTDTGYSAFAGFDVLGRIVEIVSGLSLEEYFQKEILSPLAIDDICFAPRGAMRDRLCDRYFHDHGKLYAGADLQTALINEMMDLEIGSEGNPYRSGAAGLWGSCTAYHQITRMLANEGILNGVRILKAETVHMMRTQAAEKHMEAIAIGECGCIWGLGVIICEAAEKKGTLAIPGTFGWSGAYGTHMFVEPQSGLCATFMTSVTNCGGSIAPVSMALQRMIFEIWG